MILHKSLVFIFLLGFASLAQARKPIAVKGALATELNNVLKATDELHTAFYEQDEPKIAAKIKGLMAFIDRAQSRSGMASSQQPHLEKMLEAAKANLELTRMTSGESRQEPLRETFRQLVQIAQVYKLDRYRIYFCHLDKSVWLQKSSGPKNPIHPKKYGECGRVVRY
ncbi:MAG: hypothetical protein CL677_09125 [Bdellovibrionaceae bacterium]|nr:hypothetical protein [Pseudobdellovibrionaceae bacterium]|tara:strand:+ start:276 stop:779 length:504 start_codon:yes stop_codon:yes gene_type:complete